MFEGWLYPLIASYLGHYVKGLQKEQARFSALQREQRTRKRPDARLVAAAARGPLERRGAAGERGPAPRGASLCCLSCAATAAQRTPDLPSSRLRQAFEYLQLPFAIRAGTAGRLELQARVSRVATAALRCVRSSARALADKPSVWAFLSLPGCLEERAASSRPRHPRDAR